ncbi:hypothetical protein [Streptomyces sp. NPDC088794]|uniref:hypothetical protein n=1 Tax=Streptomyces sp. NPDC088794 TaxID=3365902 RepID=UPI00382EE728
MRAIAMRTAVTLCLAAALAAAAGAPSSAGPSSPAAPVVQPQAVPVLVDCLWHTDVRPGDFTLACGDGNSRLTSLKWSQWGTETATAEGVNMLNDCKPYCAAGTFRSYPVVVRLSDPKPWKKHPGTRHYTRITLSYPDSRPDIYGPTVTYPLWD